MKLQEKVGAGPWSPGRWWVVATIMVSSTAHAAPDGWERVKDADGITIYSRPTAKSSTHSFKAVAVVEAPVRVVFNLLMDVKNLCSWYYPCKRLVVLKSQHPSQKTVYTVWKGPWPTSDRDEVVSSSYYHDPQWQTATVRMVLGDQRLVPLNPKHVRIREMTALLYLRSVGPRRTKLSYDVTLDIAGSVPSFLSRTYVKRHPYHTLLGLKKNLGKKEYWQQR